MGKEGGGHSLENQKLKVLSYVLVSQVIYLFTKNALQHAWSKPVDLIDGLGNAKKNCFTYVFFLNHCSSV